MITGIARVDLTSARWPDKAAFEIADVPTGASVEVIVGSLPPDPAACRVIKEHIGRVRVRVVGTPRAVGRWLAALGEA